MQSVTPRAMRAVEIDTPGPSARLLLCTRPVPDVGEGEVLIRVAAAGLNRLDLGQRLGRYLPPPSGSDLLGLEVSGTVAAIGQRVTRWRIGDRVCALLSGGGYAEYAAAAADLCLPVPRSMSLVEAAALPEAAFTVWGSVFMQGRLQLGDTLLVQGGASGIGTTAIQIAAMLGRKVFATAGTDEKCALCTRLGAAVAINYRKQDFVAALKDVTAGRGVDVILDMVAGDYVDRELQLLANGGRLVLIGYQGGTRISADFAHLRRRLSIQGSALRPLSIDEKSVIRREIEQALWPRIDRGEIRPVIDSVFTLEQAERAHARMQTGAHMGKIMLAVA